MKSEEGSTVIGRSVIIKGELSGGEDLLLDGTIEGKIALPESRLTVGPNAVVRADILAHDVVVLGHIEGNVKATSRIEMRQSGSILGDIVASRLSIEESATIRGKVELTGEGRAAAPSQS
jgi:cytoskeletal protein CcmA (bactofilin family)